MFSIVMATYNGARYIEKQIETLILQTRKPAELIVSDDGSTDNTIEIVERLRPDMPFLVTVRRNSSQRGYAENFLSACELASQPYICFCDQDDVWFPEKLGYCAELIAAMPSVSMFVHQGEVVDELLRPTGSNNPKIDRDHFQPPLTGNLFQRPPGFATCFSRELITKHGWRERPTDFQFVNAPAKHDAWITTLANVEGGAFFTSRTLSLYRRHSRNSSYWDPGTNLERRIGQIVSLTRNPNMATLEHEERAYREHESYFLAFAGRAGLTRDASDRYNRIARQYRRGCELVAHRLSYYRSTPAKRASLLVKSLRTGMYYDGARFNRRCFFQDFATVMRSPANATS
jgi:glycosyltransferase involved in cell wall biosynthesis